MNLFAMIRNVWKVVFDVAEVIVSICIAAGLLLYGGLVDKTLFQNDALLWSGVVAILIVMAIGNLRDRRSRLGVILKEIKGNKIREVVRADEFFQEHQEDYASLFRNAASIDIIGITLSTSSRTISDLLKERLKAHTVVRIVILDSTCEDSMTQLVKRSWSKQAKVEKYKAMLENTSDLLQEIGAEKGLTGSLEIGYLNFIPTIGMTLIDANTNHAFASVTLYHQLKREQHTFRVGVDDDPKTFAYYHEQFESMWNECKLNKVKKVV